MDSTTAINSANASFDMTFETDEIFVDLIATENIIIETVEGEHYEGDVDITPSPSSDITLETEGYLMDSDVTVRKIPYYETSNESGITIYIGGN